MRLDFDTSLCRFSTLVRVRWADTDAVGIAYNGAYLTWFEVARVEYFRAFKAWKLGVSLDDPRVQDALYDGQQEAYTLASTTINWRFPARPDMRLRVATRICRVGRTSFEHEYVITRVTDGGLVALGASSEVRVDPVALRPTPLAPDFKSDFEAFEQALAEGKVHAGPTLA
jgi:acyl-CoA thioester hydrolase